MHKTKYSLLSCYICGAVSTHIRKNELVFCLLYVIGNLGVTGNEMPEKAGSFYIVSIYKINRYVKFSFSYVFTGRRANSHEFNCTNFVSNSRPINANGFQSLMMGTSLLSIRDWTLGYNNQRCCLLLSIWQRWKRILISWRLPAG